MPETGEQKRQRVAENLRRLKAANRPQSEVDEYLASEREAAKPEFTTADKVGAGAQTFADAATFGLAGLADDALTAAATDQDFKDIRGARRTAEESLPSGVRTGLEIAGALATPIPGSGTIKAGRELLTAAKEGKALAPAGRALLKSFSPGNTLLPTMAKGEKIFGGVADKALRFGSHIAEAGAQGGLAGTVEHLDDASEQGFLDALENGVAGARNAAAFAVPIGAAGEVVGRLGSRAAKAKKLDVEAQGLHDTIRDVDKVNYGNALSQEAEPLSPKMTKILNHPDIRPVVMKLRTLEQFKDSHINDPEFLSAVYQNAISDWEGALSKKADVVDQTKPNVLRGTKEHVAALRKQFLEAMDTQVPGYRKAVEESAANRRTAETFGNAADEANAIMKAQRVPGKKLGKADRQTYLRKVEQMSPEDADVAIRAMLGELRGKPIVSTNILGGFGLIPSAVRAPLSYNRLRPVLNALDERRMTGLPGSNFPEVLAEALRGITARGVGAQGGDVDSRP